MHGRQAESLQFDLPTSTATSCYQQQDADCGILTIANALVVAKGYDIADTIKAMDRERLKLIRYYLFFSIMKESFDSHGTANLLTLKSVFLGLDDSDLQSSGNVTPTIIERNQMVLWWSMKADTRKSEMHYISTKPL